MRKILAALVLVAGCQAPQPQPQVRLLPPEPLPYVRIIETPPPPLWQPKVDMEERLPMPNPLPETGPALPVKPKL